MQLSGAQMKGLDRYAQDYASTEFGAARNRFVGDQDRTVNYLTGATNRGITSASAMAGIGQNASGASQNNANQQGGYLTSMGNASAAGTIAGGNAMQSGLNQAYNAYNDYKTGSRLRSNG